MKKILLVLVTLVAYCASYSQTCSAPFVENPASLTESCNLSGADAYAISVVAASDSTLAITGFYREPGTVIADIDCNTQTFTIAAQSISNNFYMTGMGGMNGQLVGFTYDVYSALDSTLLETCTSGYVVTAVGLPSEKHDTRLYLYPNPARESATLRIDGLGTTEDQWTYQVLDLQGRAIAKGVVNDQWTAIIDLSGLAQGMYHVVVQSSDAQLASKALMVQ